MAPSYYFSASPRITERLSYERVPLSRLRQRIAERLKEAQIQRPFSQLLMKLI